MILFGIAFYSAMSAFRKMAKTTEASTRRDEATADKAVADKAAADKAN